MNGKPYTIQPSQTQALAVGTKWEIEFSPGPNAANKTYSLAAEGTYAFVVKDAQWDLAASEFQVRVHNPANGNTDLNYVVDGVNSVVKAGSTAEHRSRLPLLIQFDRGNSSSTATKVLQQKGDYYFALNSDSEWELFSGQVPAAKGTSAGQVTIARPPLDSLRKAAGTLLFDFAQSRSRQAEAIVCSTCSNQLSRSTCGQQSTLRDCCELSADHVVENLGDTIFARHGAPLVS